MSRRYVILFVGLASVAVLGAMALAISPAAAPEASSVARGFSPDDVRNVHHALREIARGREMFRFDTFGNEVFWGETLRHYDQFFALALSAAEKGDLVEYLKSL